MKIAQQLERILRRSCIYVPIADKRKLACGSALPEGSNMHALPIARDPISMRGRTQLFNERFPFLAIADHERVIFAMCGPRAARDFGEIYKLPISHVCFLQAKIIAHSR